MGEFDTYVSRDEIRFSLVPEGEEYFSREDEVWKIFLYKISIALRNDKTVWADATHLNKKSRLKLLHNLHVEADEIEVVWIKTSLENALAQNELRSGTRTWVPCSAIERMFNALEEPEFHEGKFTYNKIYIIEPNKPIVIKEEK
jgi:predicted kinase